MVEDNNTEEKSLSQIYNESMKEITASLLDKTSNTTTARILIQKLIDTVSNEYDLTSNIHSFDNTIETILYFTFIGEKGEIVSSIPLHYIYYFSGLAFFDDAIYEDAIINLSSSLRLNPFFAKSMFKIAQCKRNTNDLDGMYNYLMDIHKYIYNADDLSDFYGLLGDYYFDSKNYDLANVLYSYSEYYKKKGYNQQQLTKIAKFQGRLLKQESVEEIVPYLKERNIPVSINEEILDKLVSIYKVPTENSSSQAIKAQAKKILFDLTKNEVFATSNFIRNDLYGFIFEIPETWEVIPKSSYNKNSTSENTLYVIKPLSKVTINIDYICELEESKLLNKYNEIKNKYITDGYSIVEESMMKSGIIHYIQSFIGKKILNDRVIDVHNYIVINNCLIDFSIPIDVVSNDKDTLLNDKNVIRINNLLNSLKIIKKDVYEEEIPFL